MHLTKTTVSNSQGEIGRWLFPTEEAANKAITDLAAHLKTDLIATLETCKLPDHEPQPPTKSQTIPINWN